MAVEDDNFFSRWSRRKVQVRSGEVPAAEPPAPVAARTAGPRAAAVPVQPASTEEAPAAPPPPPTLEDAAALTPESDFKRFVARNVPANVRNAAVKKLFADPHFNVMDGLDIYIDDYSQPSPLSAAMMAKMVGAQFLKLVDDPNEVKPPAVPAKAAVDHTLNPAAESVSATALSDAGAQSASSAIAPDPKKTPQDDHADLQLQPDHAPERESAGRGTG
jgi:hypothetical protein